MIPSRLAAAAMALLAGFLAAQEPRPESADAVVRRYEKGLLAIQGVREITPEQRDGADVISIRVETVQAKETVSLLIGGKLGPFPVRIVVSATPLPESPPTDPPNAPERACAHCPIHCTASTSRLTVAESKAEPSKAESPESPQEQCDVARKWLGLSRRKNPPGAPCEEMVSWSDSPEKIKWVISKRLPHWRSQDMPGLRGSDKGGIDCPEHGKHPQGEFVCFTWIKHHPACPLESKVAPMDLLQGFGRKSER
ncbi:MAG TPA: hypothetical protein VKW04_00435 [Planctomycetota bacterium]|nr:hypothetical protein [Planctomycetota bacterium]